MIVRSALNFAAHFAAGIAFGMLAVAACAAWRRTAQSASQEREPRPTATGNGQQPQEGR